MENTFKGRVILPGRITGEAVVSRKGFNILSSFYRSILDSDTQAKCSDHDNPDLYGKNLTDKIICLSKTVGSTSAGTVIDKVASMGIGPKAFLFSGRIDSLAAAGIVLADVWVGRRIVTLDQLGTDFLTYVNNGTIIEIWKDGTVQIK